MIEMSNSEYNELLNDLYAKVEAGEMTEETYNYYKKNG